MSMIFFNRLEDVTKSVIGPNGTVAGSLTYAAAHWGNGEGPETNVNYATYTSVVPSASQGLFSVSWYWKPAYASNDGGIYTILSLFKATYDYNNGIHMYHYQAGLPFGVAIYQAGTLKTYYTYNTAFSAGAEHHIAMLCNSSAGAGGKVQIYMDGTLLTPSGTTFDTAWAIGANLDMSLQDAGISNNNNALNDNIKVYNHLLSAAEIKRDIYAERGNLNDISTIV